MFFPAMGSMDFICTQTLKMKRFHWRLDLFQSCLKNLYWDCNSIAHVLVYSMEMFVSGKIDAGVCAGEGNSPTC